MRSNKTFILLACMFILYNFISTPIASENFTYIVLSHGAFLIATFTYLGIKALINKFKKVSVPGKSEKRSLFNMLLSPYGMLSRKDYLIACIINSGILSIFTLIYAYLLPAESVSQGWAQVLWSIAAMLIIGTLCYSAMCVILKRCRHAHLPGWIITLHFIPTLNFVIPLVLLFMGAPKKKNEAEMMTAQA